MESKAICIPGPKDTYAKEDRNFTEKMSKYVVGGVVSYHKDLQECQEELQDWKQTQVIVNLKQAINKKKENLQKYQAQLEEVKVKLNTCSGQDSQTIQAKIDRLRALVDKEESDLDRTKYELGKLHDVENKLLAKQRETDTCKEFVATIRNKTETKSVSLFDKNRHKQYNIIKNALEDYSEEVINKMNAAAFARKHAEQQGTSTKQLIQAARNDLNEERTKRREKRKTDILQLKTSTNSATSETIGRNQQVSEKEKDRKEKEAAEFDKLLSQGKNPYEVFRKRKQDVKARVTRERLNNKIKQSEMVIIERTLAFEDYTIKKEKEEARAKAYEEKYKNSLGRKYKEETISKYMKSRTIGNVDSIDPTGRSFRVQPSKVTVTKPHRFGLGMKDRPDIIEKIEAKVEHKDVEPNWKLITQKKMLKSIGQQASYGLQDYSKAESSDNLMGEQELPPGFLDQLEELQNPDAKRAREEAESELELVAKLPDVSEVKDIIKNDASRENSNRRYKQRQLSALEKRMHEQARERHRNNFVKEQIIWGNKFTGTAFLAKPVEILFKDFIIGKTYTRKFILTNVSYTFNSFKLMDLPGDIKNFFEVSYEKPGRMSAGMNCTITVKFEPKINEDIISEVPFLGHTGSFSVPLKCFTRKIKPSLSKSTIDFGSVIIGEEVSKTLTIKNDGALETDFEVIKVSKESTSETIEKSIKVLTIDKPSGRLGAYSKQVITFKFSPTITQHSVKLNYAVRCSNKECKIKELPIQVKGIATDIPVFVDSQEVNMHCCVLGKLYRAKQMVRNRGNVALKLTVKTPDELKNEIEFQPKVAFIQGRDTNTGVDGSFELQLKFRPSKKLTTWCKKNVSDFDETSGIHEVPVTLIVANQVLPVQFIVRACLTTSDLVFTPSSIDFGKCYINQSVQIPLKIKNLSALPQKFGFVKLKPQVEVQPNDGFGTLLPNETREVNVIYNPSTAVPESFPLQLNTFLNRTFLIQCKGYGIQPPIRFSNSLIKFSATSMNSKVRQSFFVTNTTEIEQILDFVLPDTFDDENERWKNHCFKISPLVCNLQPGKSRRVEVEFNPISENIYHSPDAQAIEDFNKNFGCSILYSDFTRTKNVGAKSVEDIEKKIVDEVENTPEIDHEEISLADDQGHSGSENVEPWSKHCNWKIPCFVRSSGPKSDSMVESPPLLLQIETTTIEPQLQADKVNVRFKQVPIGHSKIITVRIKNTGTTCSPLNCDGFNALGPFSTVNALRQLEPGKSRPVMIKFQPEHNLKYCETLSCQTLSGRVDIKFTGQGVSPELAVEADDDATGAINPNILDFGHVFQNESTHRKFRIRNCSVFPIDYKIVSIKSACSNFNGLEVFSVSPQEASILEGETLTVIATFSPDHEQNTAFQAQFKVDVPNQLGEHNIFMSGHCWDMPIYMFGGEKEACDKVNDPLALPGSGLKLKRKIFLSADASVDYKATISIGSCSSKLGGSFEFTDVDQSFLTIDTYKGVIKAEETQQINVVWNVDTQTNTTQTQFLVILKADGYPDRVVELVFIKREN